MYVYEVRMGGKKGGRERLNNSERERDRERERDLSMEGRPSK